MDSCHIFNFLFGTKKATTELSRCFTSVVVRRDGNNNNKYSDDCQSPAGSNNKKIKSKKSSSGNVFTHSASCGKMEMNKPTDQDSTTQAPLSPLKQLQKKIVQSFSPSSTSLSSTLPNAKTNQTPEKPHIHETNVSCDAKSGTYHARLVATVDDDDEEQDYKDEALNPIKIIENPVNQLMQTPLDRQPSSIATKFREPAHPPFNKINIIENPQVHAASESGDTMNVEGKTTKIQPAVTGTRSKGIVLYDDKCREDFKKENQSADEFEDQKIVVDQDEVFDMILDHPQKITRGSLGKIESLSSTETNTSQKYIDLVNEIRDNELKSLRDKRNVYVQNLVKSIELNGSFDQPKDLEELQGTILDDNNNNLPPSNTGHIVAKSARNNYNKPITFVKPLPPKTPPKTNKAKCLNIQLSLNKPTKINQLFKDEQFLIRFFDNLEPLERCVAAQVCRLWRNILYSNQNYWKELINVIDCTQLRREQLIEYIMNTLHSAKLRQQQNHKAPTTNTRSISFSNEQDMNNNSILNSYPDKTLNNYSSTISSYKDFSYFNVDQEDVWRIQELCNRFTYRVSQQQQHARQASSNNESAGNHMTQENNICTTSKSSSIPSQISSTLSSLSISSLLSPLSESSRVESMKEKLYISLDDRGFDAMCLFGATDEDIDDLIVKLPSKSHKRIIVGRLNNCFITNRGLEVFITTFNNIEELELSGCNELTNSFDLKPLSNLKRLIITDCINIADGLAQKLVHIVDQLNELTIQAYHLTDSFLEYLSLNANITQLKRLELPNCKEITNHSLMTIAKHFPHLQILSVSGSTKISDDGIEILADQATQLKVLDLSWCPRISDASLECLACDLGDNLMELILDRNLQITDVGLGYLTTMSKLMRLNIRWCPRISDVGLEAIIAIRSLKYLSIAGLHQITARSLLYLVEADQLEEIELTNCPAVNNDLRKFLAKQLPKCNIIF